MAMNRDKRRSNNEAAGADDALKEVVVFVNRCAKTVKGGRRMSFSAVVVVGNPDEHQVEERAGGHLVADHGGAAQHPVVESGQPGDHEQADQAEDDRTDGDETGRLRGRILGRGHGGNSLVRRGRTANRGGGTA